MHCFTRSFLLIFQFSKSLSRTPSPFKKTEDIVAATVKIKQTIKYVVNYFINIFNIIK